MDLRRLARRVVERHPDLARGVAFAPFHWGELNSAPGAGAVSGGTHAN